MTLRAEFALNHAIKGFGMDFEKALELLRNHNDGLTKLEKEQRNILVAALDNLVDFAVAEEFQMSENLPDNFNISNEVDLAEAENIFTDTIAYTRILKTKILNMRWELLLVGFCIAIIQC